MRPSPALVIAVLALFVALGGTTYAVQRLPKRSVGPAQLRTDAVRNKNIKAGAVSRSKIRRKAVTADQVGTDALLGRNILESSLGKVPDADKVDGQDSSRLLSVTRIDRFTLGDGERRKFFESGAVSLTAICDTDGPSPPGTAVALIELTGRLPGVLHAGGANADLQANQPADFVRAGGDFEAIGDGAVLIQDGTQLTGVSLYAAVNTPGFENRCAFGGFIPTS